MYIRGCLLLVGALAVPGGVSAADSQSTAATPVSALHVVRPPADKCTSADPDTVLVCGRPSKRYRIDSSVLAARRAAEAPPPKAALDASASVPCTGNQCGGDMIPLVGMALTAVKAVDLALEGEDWREALRTKPDEYRIYQQRKAEQERERRVTFGVSVGNERQ